MRSGVASEFDLHRLQCGDAVEVFIDGARGWCRGTFEVTTAGEAIVELSGGETVALAEALRRGIRPPRPRTSP